MTEPNEPIVWQPPVEQPPAPSAAAAPMAGPVAGPTPLTEVAPVTAEAPSFQARIGRGNALRAAIGLVAAVAIVASVAVVVGTLPASSTAGAAPQATNAPGASGAPRPGFRGGGPAAGFAGLLGGLFGGPGGPSTGGFGGPALGGVTIASINGSSIGLKTADGWTRTITVDSSVKVTEAGQTMSASDLKVGMAVRLGEKRDSDGTFTVTGLDIVVPSVVGQVTAKTATTITIKRFDGTTETIDVDSSTVFHINGAATSNLAAVTVGMTIIAQGPQNTDGSVHALSIAGGKFAAARPFGNRGPKPSGSPKPSAAPQT